MPIDYLPDVHWFAVVLQKKNVCFNRTEKYVKNNPRNRCIIATATGAQRLTVPLLQGRNQRKRLDEVEISYTQPWERQHIHAIKTAYGKSPYFIYYADTLFNVLESRPQKLIDLNLSLIDLLLRWFDIDHTVSENNNCRDYLKAIGGIVYRQVFADRTQFIPNCTAFDLLFNYGPDSRQILGEVIIE